MSFTSETIINAPQPVVWDAIESGWRDVADGTAFEPDQFIRTPIDLDGCNMIPEPLRRKIGEKLWVTVTILDMVPGQSISARTVAGIDYLPTANLSLSLFGTNDQTRLMLSGDLRASLKQKPVASIIRPALAHLGNYGLGVLGSNIIYEPGQSPEQQIDILPDEYLKVS